MKGQAAGFCHGDTMAGPKLPALADGKTWQHGGLACRSEQAGLTWPNAMPHGFSLSRAKQELF